MQNDANPAAAPATGTGATEFRPVEGGGQMQSGEKLLVEAYAVIWVIAFAVLLMTWRKQRALDRRVAELEAVLAKAARGGVARDAGGH